jgi:hypothetical protein
VLGIAHLVTGLALGGLRTLRRFHGTPRGRARASP